MRKQLLDHGLVPAPGTREALRDYIAREAATRGEVIRERKITAQ